MWNTLLNNADALFASEVVNLEDETEKIVIPDQAETAKPLPAKG